MRIKKIAAVRGIFVTGTDTGAGKTYVSCLIASAVAAGRRVSVFKPYLSGSRADARKLLAASGSSQRIDEVNPYFFKAPLAPFVAARLEKKRISVAHTVETFKKACRAADFVIVEGAGGLFVPVAGGFHIIDLIKKLRLPAVLVSRAGLGAINHTLLSVEALSRRKIRTAAVVINNYTGRGAAQKTNPAVIRKYVSAPVFVVKKDACRAPKGLLKCILKKV
ncbi:MAG: dethiobiotin synthase [Elusimicrobia bacterium HGW-Elusimicrobia-1]|jgi:dethiobiotin synthetase|nr:MAG: dethiobiotin synthase [Elusimicrobia bacterium HGW-Elusimicrobia-1]